MTPRELFQALRKIQIISNRLASEQLSGNYESVFKGRGLAFSEVRRYLPGDDVRSIDWNVSARMNDTFVKVFVEEREMNVMLVVDLSASGEFGTREMSKIQLAARVAALCAFSAAKHDDRVGLIMTTDRVEKLVPPMKGQKHVARVVREILGAAPVGTGTDLRVAFETLHHVARRRSVAFILSDFFADGHERALSLAAARHDLIPVLLVDPRDEALPNVGLATFEDLETGVDVVIDTSSPAVRERYARLMREQRARQIRLFRKLRLDHVIVRTDQPYVRPLRDLFMRRARRARR
ncbi:MAG: DUF58 domain-containing protein [Polyangiaceae bacterium]|nr:DUF58 domain-containing protein [Polyangiaceae bacterium]